MKRELLIVIPLIGLCLFGAEHYKKTEPGMAARMAIIAVCGAGFLVGRKSQIQEDAERRRRGGSHGR